MKLLVPLLSLALIGATGSAAAEEDAKSEVAEMADDDAAEARPPEIRAESSGTVIDPDRRCADNVTVAEGNEGEAEFRRQPAGPNPPPLYRAVDISVDGCDMLLSMSGELRSLPEAPGEPRVQSAQ